MKENVLLASVIGIVNTVALNLCKLLSDAPDLQQVATNVSQVVAPFVALLLMRLYTKMDVPGDLVRKEAAVNDAIKTCQSHLKMKGIDDEFKAKTQKNLSELMLQKQRLRLDYELTNTYQSSFPNSSEPDSKP